VMFATRKFDFHLTNKSAIALNYKFTFRNDNPTDLANRAISNLYTSYDKTLTPQDDAGGPFLISPSSGTIPASSDELITLRFSPLEVDEYNFKRTLICNIKDLDKNQQPLKIEISGEAERPLCHFEMEGGIKREGGCTIIQFESIGMMIKNTVRFFALNPTNQGYEFQWEQQDEDLIPAVNKVFRCLTPKGVIYSGKKFEMIFEYLPNNLGKHQAFFNFKILNESSQPHKFVLNGIAREPMILFNVGKVNFGPLLIGGRQKETVEIINEEILPYKFSFDKDSIKGNQNYADSLIVSPICGTLQPKSSTKVEITFMPRVEREFNYNLCLKVKQRQKPLTLNVKGVGYTIVHGVYLDNKPDMKLQRKVEHIIDFGEFFVNEQRERKIILENNGSFNFNYVMKKNGADYLKIDPDQGTVKQATKQIITLTLLPLQKINLQKHKIFLNIISGSTYTFLVSAKAKTPQIIFSSIKCNFGPCYVLRQAKPIEQVITVKNMDKEALTIETDFDSKNKTYLDVDLPTGQVILPYQEPKDVLDIPIRFIPREYTKYKDTVKFKFNNIYTVEVEITGEGIPMKVELEDPSMQVLNFDIIKLGQKKNIKSKDYKPGKTMEFNVINRGKITTNVQIFPESIATWNKRCLAIRTDFSKDNYDDIDHPKIHELKPKETMKVEVTFNPNIRIPQFNEDLVMRINDTEQRRLLTVTGASYGVDVKMVGEMPTFGKVTKNSNSKREIFLKNFGDIPAAFEWEGSKKDSKIKITQEKGKKDTKKKKVDYTEWFSIIPSSGTIPPHEEVKFDIIFHPKEIKDEIACEHIKCFIEESDSPIEINLYGSCIECPTDSIANLPMSTEVRKPTTIDLKVKNTSTDKTWRLIPSISSANPKIVSYFTGNEKILEIPPNQEGTYVLTYKPLTMTKIEDRDMRDESHDATVFFPLPTGEAKIFKIKGTSLKPTDQEIISANAVVREWTCIILNVPNWLYEKQRFKVDWNKKNLEQGIFINGADTIDVAPNSTKEYKLNFRSLKDTPYSFKITFKNEATQEYVFFTVNVTMSAAKPLSSTELIGPVREIVTGSFSISNPLTKQVDISESDITIENEYLSISPKQISIDPNSEVTVDVTVRPLIVGRSTSNIIIKSQELGTLTYPITVEGTEVLPKNLPPMVASLGSDKIIQVYFTHYLKKPSTYTIKVEKYSEGIPFNDFIPEVATLNADPSKGQENSFNLKYEPSNVSETKGILKATSADGGEYQWILTGKPTFPQAQGPFEVPPGKNYALEFKNPLNEKVTVKVRFDNPNFSAGAKADTVLEAKKSLNLPISFKKVNDTSGNTGRCIITINNLPSWVYYLSAIENAVPDKKK
ncbi:MAG: hypothetical protein MJ252_13390, partial [archaeon]|nr:hypothetical protein [archaeon]